MGVTSYQLPQLWKGSVRSKMGVDNHPRYGFCLLDHRVTGCNSHSYDQRVHVDKNGDFGTIVH
jgi:hypothetical protein